MLLVVGGGGVGGGGRGVRGGRREGDVSGVGVGVGMYWCWWLVGGVGGEWWWRLGVRGGGRGLLSVLLLVRGGVVVGDSSANMER